MAFLEGIFTNLGNAMSLLVISSIIDIIQSEMADDAKDLGIEKSTLKRIRETKLIGSDVTVSRRIKLIAKELKQRGYKMLPRRQSDQI
jgi:hypothetical protein